MPFPPPHPEGRRLTGAKNGITLRTATTATATVDYDHEGAEAYTVGLCYCAIDYWIRMYYAKFRLCQNVRNVAFQI